MYIFSEWIDQEITNPIRAYMALHFGRFCSYYDIKLRSIIISINGFSAEGRFWPISAFFFG
jgi:hypothetical protein